jgi:hypothetical protein
MDNQLKMLAVVSVLIFLAPSSALARNCQAIDNTICYDNGTSYNTNGNTTFGSDGSWSTRVGNARINSDGSSSQSQQIGNTRLNSDGLSSQRTGNIIFKSDGTSCQIIGNQVFCN